LLSIFYNSIILFSLKKNIGEVAIFYGGDVGHPQSRSMFQRYTLQEFMQPSENFRKEDFQHIALVDSSLVSDARCKGSHKE
jgi:nanoRNase/pAp phosphatase (c-di-AMP/oligoRNAs hydrolase)